MTGIYQPPTPPIGPDRAANTTPLTDRSEVVAARHVLTGEHVPDAFIQPHELRVTLRVPLDPAAGYGPSQYLDGALADLGPEQFASHEEYVAAAHEIWGDDL